MLIELVLRALAEVGLEIRRELLADRAWRKANPCKVAAFHNVMSQSIREMPKLPRVRWLARVLRKARAGYHERAYQRWHAWCRAEDQVKCNRLSDSATDLVLAFLADPNVVDDESARTKRLERRGRRV